MSEPRVLVVEDDSAIRSLIVAALRSEPLEVHTASDGLAALDCIRSSDYAVILLDLMMPRVNGYDFLESMEVIRPDAQAVVIVMTAFDTTALRRMRSNRVHAVLHKPFDVERVVALIRDCAFAPRLSVRDAPEPEPETHAQSGSLPLTSLPDEESSVC